MATRSLQGWIHGVFWRWEAAETSQHRASLIYDWLQRAWYGNAPGALFLLPLSWLFRLVVACRRFLYRGGVLRSYPVERPVVVVGNISVGGTGKTPLTLWLAAMLSERGLRPGIASRGYGGRTRAPRLVRPEEDAAQVGDEALLMARAGMTVAIGEDRVAVARLLVREGCDVVISDDGLQHLRLRRDVEIAVVDGQRRLGNGQLLPAGPLREPPRRLQSVDAVVVNGGAARPPEIAMSLVPRDVVSLANAGTRPLAEFRGQRVHAVAAIGNPQRFFALLRDAGITPIEHALPDHAVLAPADVGFEDRLAVLMTEKDAVKCRGFADDRHWAVRVQARIAASDAERLAKLIMDRVAARSA